MRMRAEWMVPSDDQILEILRDKGNLTPLAVSEFGGPSRPYVRERLPKLTKYGLVDRISAGLYQITDDGRAYLDEELDASTLDPIDE
jgi:Mn-dependent DtxR family transcriptional regulator